MGVGEKRKLDSTNDKREGKGSPSPKRQVIGPSLPPSDSIPGHEQTQINNQSDNDSSDDDFGPSLPPAHGGSTTSLDLPNPRLPAPEAEPEIRESQRDQWMLQPPEGSDWAKKIDPTRIRNRKFQSGNSARTGSKQPDSSWTETPEERLRRLQDEVMGVRDSPSNAGKQSSATTTARTKAMEEKIQRYNDRTGKNTRLESQVDARKEKEDDPSARAFDREKDMALSSSITNAQRREMVNKASGYNSRFTKGNFL